MALRDCYASGVDVMRERALILRRCARYARDAALRPDRPRRVIVISPRHADMPLPPLFMLIYLRYRQQGRIDTPGHYHYASC